MIRGCGSGETPDTSPGRSVAQFGFGKSWVFVKSNMCMDLLKSNDKHKWCSSILLGDRGLVGM